MEVWYGEGGVVWGGRCVVWREVWCGWRCGVDERGEVECVGKEVKRDMLGMEREVLESGEVGRVTLFQVTQL